MNQQYQSQHSQFPYQPLSMDGQNHINPYEPMYEMVPQTVSIGGPHNQSTQFDDLLVLRPLPQPYKLYSITVSYTDKYIQGIGFTYKVGDGKMIETRHNLCNGLISKLYFGVYEKHFILGENDYIKRISGRYGDWLDRLEFETYLGKNQNYGGKGGDKQFNFCFPGYTFQVASGSFASFIEELKFYVVPIPDNFQQKVGDIPYTPFILYPSGYQSNAQMYPNQSHVQQSHMQHQHVQQSHVQQSHVSQQQQQYVPQSSAKHYQYVQPPIVDSQVQQEKRYDYPSE